MIYYKCIYPVVPKKGELIVNKPEKELTQSDIASGKTIAAKLFIKDYHNIRGTTTDEVTSSSLISIKKSGFGVYNS